MDKRGTWVVGVALLLVQGAVAQQPVRVEGHGHALGVMQWIGDGDGGEAGGGPTFMSALSATSIDGKPVKGAPYSAEAATELVQTLADGNRIVRKTTANVYRDSEGRTRREQNLGAVGPAGEGRQQVLINDAVSGFSYALNPKERTARKLHKIDVVKRVGKDDKDAKVAAKIFEKHVEIIRGEEGGPMPWRMEVRSMDVAGERGEVRGGQSESLGKQTMEGLEAEGTRTTVTIPAGKIGNEQPLQIVTERWYSPELQAVVLSRHSDPRFGETTYRLTNIVRAEPQRALFEVPVDYEVKKGPPPGDVVIRKVEKSVKSQE